MNEIKNSFSMLLAALLLVGGFVAQVAAQPGGRINEREITRIVTKLNVQLDNFGNRLNDEGRRSPANRDDVNQLSDYLDDLRSDVESFQDKVYERRDSQDDVRQILDSAKSVDDGALRLRLSNAAQNDWNQARASLDQLATKYNISWNWTNGANQNYPNSTNRPNQNYPANANFSNNLTGTYQLDAARSENVVDIAEEAINSVEPPRREEARRDLEQKIQSPEGLAIDLRGSQVTLASTLAPQITFPADGTDRTETLPDGDTIRIRATLRGQVLTVASLSGANDYTVTFTPIDNGRSLKVTRRVTTDYLRQTVFAESFYTKTDQTARLGDFDNPSNSAGNVNNYPGNNVPTGSTGNLPPSTTTRRRIGQFIIPNGTILTGILENPLISTKISQNNDPFKLRVQAPAQFRGALVEGYLSGVRSAGRVSGRSHLTFNFERITLANGEVYDFSGFLQSVTDERGKTIKVDSEGTARNENRTATTAVRSGIGTGIGAVLGAIAGGGKGAAIGAIIGGAAGAGSVYVQNDGDLELREGSSLTFQASSPLR